MKVMELPDILKDVGVKATCIVNPDSTVEHITANSKHVRKGSLFVAIKGISDDGHRYVEEAVKLGASVIVYQREDLKPPEGISYMAVKDSRKALAVIASHFYGEPSLKLKLVGVTGTNGKSSTVFILHHLMEGMGVRSGFIGTLGASWCNSHIPTPNTTPDPIFINSILSKMVSSGVEYVFMEVSSHSIDQERIYGLNFHSTFFTKGGRDHIDYHKTIASYMETKKRFIKSYGKTSFINLDDQWGLELWKELRDVKRCVSLSIRSKRSDYRIENYLLTDSSTEGILTKNGKPILPFSSNLIGRYNLYNILNALSFAIEEGFEEKCVAESMSKVPPVPGRMERISKGVFLDYAHTPDALKSLLGSAREITSGKLILIFGCGGDRDKGKRPEMGRIAEKLADIVLVTSDNPRKEDPMMIIDEIVSGMEKRPLSEEEMKKTRLGTFSNPDRRWMIEFAFRIKEKDDTVLVAGKGHENYMELGSRRIPYSDREAIIEKLQKVFGKRWKERLN